MHWNSNRCWIDNIFLDFKRSRTNRNAKREKEYRVQTDKNKDWCASFKFDSNYYHHCYCSNERFSKSIESLLILFAVIFIFYCQTIIMKSMFSSYQIDLSSRNSFFINISSVSFSFILFSTVRYIMSMLTSKFSEALHFGEYNITKFLKRFKKQCNEYKIIQKK